MALLPRNGFGSVALPPRNYAPDGAIATKSGLGTTNVSLAQDADPRRPADGGDQRGRAAARLPAVAGGAVGEVGDPLAFLGGLVDRLDRHPAGAVEAQPDVAVVQVVAPEGEAEVARVLQVQVHPDRDVPVEQRAGLDEQRLTGLEGANEGVPRRGEHQQDG